MSPSKAIRLARNQIGNLYHVCGGWTFNVWNPHVQAWILPTYIGAYANARRYRRAALVERAVRAMLIDDGVPEHEANLYMVDSDPCLYASTIDWVRAEYRMARRHA